MCIYKILQFIFTQHYICYLFIFLIFLKSLQVSLLPNTRRTQHATTSPGVIPTFPSFFFITGHLFSFGVSSRRCCRSSCALHAQSLHPYLTLCDPTDCSQLGSCVLGISQARILESVCISLSRESSQPKNSAQVFCISCIAGGFFTIESPGKPSSFSLQPCNLLHVLLLRVTAYLFMQIFIFLKIISKLSFHFRFFFFKEISFSSFSKFVWVVNLVRICMTFFFFNFTVS